MKKLQKLFLVNVMVAFFVTMMSAGCGKKNPAGPSPSSPTATPTSTVALPSPTVTSTPTIAVAPITLVYDWSITNNTSPSSFGYMNNGVWAGATIPTGGGSGSVTYLYPLASCTAGMTLSMTGNASTTYAIYCYLNGVLQKSNVGCCSATHTFSWGPAAVP